MMNKYDLTTSENDGNNGIKAIKFNQYNLFIFKIIFRTYKTHSTTWLSSWLAEQEDRFDSLPFEFSEISYLLLRSRDLAEIPLKRRKSSIQTTNQSVGRGNIERENGQRKFNTSNFDIKS